MKIWAKNFRNLIELILLKEVKKNFDKNKN